MFKRGFMKQLYEIPVWILSGPRTGSSFISSVLNDTNLFEPDFREWFHNNNINEIFCHKKSLSPFDYKWPLFAKVHEDHYEKIKTMFPLLNIEEVIPKLKFIHLRRKNLIKQAISSYFSHKTNTYIIKNKKKLNNYKEFKVDYDEENILFIYEKIISRFNFWKPVLINDNYIDVFYEELIDNPIEAFIKIFNFLGITLPSNLNIESTLIQSHPLKQEYEKKFTRFLRKNNHVIFNDRTK